MSYDEWGPLTELTPVDLSPRRARGHPEDKLQVSVWKALRVLLHPDVVCWSVENRGNGMLEGQRRRARGVLPGCPDMAVHWRGRDATYIAYIELKAPAGSVSEVQREMQARLRRIGIATGVCRSLDQVMTFLRHQGVPMRVAQ